MLLDNNNIPELERFRKRLRNEMTSAEIHLWQYIKNRQIAGAKFRRQFSVHFYILDFYCHEYKICIELDGAGHFTKAGMIKDQKRDAKLQKEGIQILRFENQTVFDHTESVLTLIEEAINLSKEKIKNAPKLIWEDEY